MSNLIRALTALSTVGISAWVWAYSHHSWLYTALTALAGALLSFGKTVWAELEPRYAKTVAGAVEHRIARIFGGYPQRYAKHLYYKHRTFDVKGFSTQGKFALDLENVYVDLSVDPSVVKDIHQDPIRLPKNPERTGERGIFIWLEAEPKGRRRYLSICHCCSQLAKQP